MRRAVGLEATICLLLLSLGYILRGRDKEQLTPMKTHQLNARIDEKAYVVLTDLCEKLHTTKGHLAEKAIYLLKEHFEKVEKRLGTENSTDHFLSLLGKSTDQYDKLYKKLSE